MKTVTNKKILLLSGWYYPDSVGGTEVYVRSLGKELQTLGCDVAVASPSIDEEEHNYTYDGLPVYRYPVSVNPGRAELREESLPKYFDAFAKWLGHLRPDIVHMHSYTRGCNSFHAQYVKQLDIPLVLTVHVPDLTCARGTMLRWGRIPCDGEIQVNRCATCYLHKRGLPRLVAVSINALPWWFIDRFEKINNRLGTTLQMRKLVVARKESVRELFNLADHIVAVSRWLYDVIFINGAPESKLSLCRHGLPPERFIKAQNNLSLNDSQPQPQPSFHPQPQTQPKPDMLRVGYIGRFNPVKGVHILIKAIKRLPSSVPVKLYLYGRTNGEEERAYFDKVKKIAGDDSRIAFCGQVTDENRGQVMGNMDVLAVPSLWMETGPFVLLEAFAAGIPVIGSNLGGIAELVRDGVNGVLVEAGNIKSWSGALKHLCLQQTPFKEMARSIPSVRSINSVTNEMVTIYRKIIDQRQYQ